MRPRPLPILVFLLAASMLSGCRTRPVPQETNNVILNEPATPRKVTKSVYREADTVDMFDTFYGPEDSECRAHIKAWIGPDVTCPPREDMEPTYVSDGAVDLPWSPDELVEDIATGPAGSTITIYVLFVEICPDGSMKTWSSCETRRVPGKRPTTRDTETELRPIQGEFPWELMAAHFPELVEELAEGAR